MIAISPMLPFFSCLRYCGGVIASLLIALLVTACGGGGGGGGSGGGGVAPITCTAPQVLTAGVCVTPAPTISDAKWPIDTGAVVKFDAKGITFALSAKVTNATAVKGTLAVTENGAAVSGATLAAWSISGATATSSVSIPAQYGKTYTVTVKATASGDGGNSTELATSLNFSVEAEPKWWPPVFAEKVVKLYLDKATAPAGAVTNGTFPGQAESGLLPPECRITGDACWKQAVQNGTVKFKETPARNPLQPNRPIAFGFYKTIDTIFFPGQNKKLYCSKPFFADDGTLVQPNDPVENGCVWDEAVYIQENDLGIVIQQKHFQTGAVACFQKKQDSVLNGWVNVETSCK